MAERLAGFGFTTVGEFVRSRPGSHFGELTKELGPDIAQIQVERMFLTECHDRGDFVHGAAECLARTIIERFPQGWGTGGRLEQRTASALAAWISNMLNRVEQSQLNEATLDAIARALLTVVQPPAGWMPTDGDDPHVQRAFSIGLAHSDA